MKIDKIYTRNVQQQVQQSLMGTGLMAGVTVASFVFKERITGVPLLISFFIFLFFLSDFIRALVDLKNLEK